MVFSCLFRCGVDAAAQFGHQCLTRLAHVTFRRGFDLLTMRLPTTTASAIRATASAVAASRMPKPTPTGRLQCLRIMAIFRATSSISRLAEPVTPLSDT